ncbi:MAG: aminotransferase class IV [Actinobacteria bacterium]|nr:aminotransferase class IV [Actinomycetota bacterium]
MQLREAFAYRAGEGARLLERHLARLRISALALGVDYDDNAIRADLHRALAGAADSIVRLRVRAHEAPTLRLDPLPPMPAEPVRIRIDSRPTDSRSLWRRHKTDRREVYEAALDRHPDVEDVLLVDESGEVSESSIANLAVRLGQRWWTPPLTSGCLPGVGRAVALEAGRLDERRLGVEDVCAAQEIALVSSARGWRPARLA